MQVKEEDWLFKAAKVIADRQVTTNCIKGYGLRGVS